MSGSMDELDKSMSFRWRSERRERRRYFAGVRTSFWRRAVRNSRCHQTMKHGYDALNMRNECRKIPRREGDVAVDGQWRRVVELCLQFIITL